MFHRSRYPAILRALPLIVLCIALSQLTGGRAGSLPNLLDDNRGSQPLAGNYSAAFTTASSIVLAPNPLTFIYEPVSVSGRVLANPSIHNLYLDDDWDAHNPGAPTVEQLDAFTQDLVNSHYFDSASQYGVGNASFTGSNQRSTLCDPLRTAAIAFHDAVSLQSWIVCEASFNPVADALGVPPGTTPALTGVPQADDNTLYVVYLPLNVTLEGDCNYGGYHFFSAVPAIHVDIQPTFSQTFAYAVIPIQCNIPTTTSQSFLDSVTESASHEIIEASVDPLWGLGWINDSPVFQVGGNIEGPLGLFTQFLGNIGFDFAVGEAADICSTAVGLKYNVPAGQIGPPPASLHPTPSFYLTVNDALLNNMIKVSPYWSNSDGACVPDGTPPVTTAQLSPMPNAAGWNDSSVKVTFASSDNEPGGTGVKEIHFTLTGAQSGSTVMSGSSASVVISAEGITTVTFFGIDNAGNQESPNTLTVAIDRTPPSVNCGSPDGLWHANDVAIPCSASDSLSGLANPSDASFSLTTSVPVGTETAGAFTNSHTVFDVAGNSTTGGPIGPNMVDKKPPTIIINQPMATQYTHSSTLTLNYTVTDGGSGVSTFTPTMNGSTTVGGSGLPSGQMINLLTTLPLGPNTFAIKATDKVNNMSSASVTFTIIVTPASIIADVNQFQGSGAISAGIAAALLTKLNDALTARNAGQCGTAANIYAAFINQVMAQTGKGITPAAAAILIADAQYLITHCP
jgi:hypothetical protein